MDEQIVKRVFALQYNLEKLEEAYQETLKDALIEVGFEYGVKYTDNKWFEEKELEYRSLMQRREDILFTTILNFTQSFY